MKIKKFGREKRDFESFYKYHDIIKKKIYDLNFQSDYELVIYSDKIETGTDYFIVIGIFDYVSMIDLIKLSNLFKNYACYLNSFKDSKVSFRISNLNKDFFDNLDLELKSNKFNI